MANVDNRPTVPVNNEGIVRLEGLPAPSQPSSPNKSPSLEGDNQLSNAGSNTGINLDELLAKLEMLDETSKRADKRTVDLGKTVQDLESSLEFSQMR